MAGAREIYRDRPTSDEIAEVLGLRLTATVGTLNEDGSVHLAYVIFLYEEPHVYFETASLTRKARNAADRHRTSMIVQGPASTGRSLMVSAEGTARALDGPEADAINHRLRAKYITPESLPGIDRAWSRLDDVCVEITPSRWRSWTGATLHEVTRKELDVPYEEAWRTD